jgi:hypothetical protein
MNFQEQKQLIFCSFGTWKHVLNWVFLLKSNWSLLPIVFKQ